MTELRNIGSMRHIDLLFPKEDSIWSIGFLAPKGDSIWRIDFLVLRKDSIQCRNLLLSIAHRGVNRINPSIDHHILQAR
jgi:hypothetical protein